MAKYHGKYRGIVLDNIDPLQIGRIMVQVPDVSNILPSTWALPCLPFYVVPDIGSGVWIEFEQGDPDYPIWVGCYWATAADVPALALAAPPGVAQVVVQTTGQNMMLVSDVPGPTGGILLKTASGAFISISDTGITIDNGQGATIAMTGPAVTVNEGAMEVI
jgi:uncharacterized protein involved in type VI secretion and phage assembly